MKRLAVLATAVATSSLIVLGAGTAHAGPRKPHPGSARIGTTPITEGLQAVLGGAFFNNDGFGSSADPSSSMGGMGGLGNMD